MIAEIYLYSSKNGGRSSMTPSGYFGCPLAFNNKDSYFDCRLMLDKTGPLSPGQTEIVPIRFLDYETVKTFISKGMKFKLWEGGFIGEGKIVTIIDL
jgi:hypothetical protein